MSERRGSDTTDELDTTGDAGDQARGINFALRSIAESRQAAKRYKDLLNTTADLNEHAIFPPNEGRDSVSLKAHAAILSYYTEVCKRPYIEAVGAEKYMAEVYTEAPVPTAITEGRKAVIDLEPDAYGVFPEEPDFDMEKVAISLNNLDWWSMRFLKIRKHTKDSYYGSEVEIEHKKVILPPNVIDDTFKRLDELASRFKLLLDIEPEGAFGKT